MITEFQVAVCLCASLRWPELQNLPLRPRHNSSYCNECLTLVAQHDSSLCAHVCQPSGCRWRGDAIF